MTDEKANLFDRAEALFRRTFEKLGAKVDAQITPVTEEMFSPREIGDLIARLEQATDAALEPDASGVKRRAPSYFIVKVTYERAVNLNRLHLEALCKELRATVAEYIANRRYATEAEVKLIIARDLFEKQTTARASFNAADLSVPSGELLAPIPVKPQHQPRDACSLVLADSQGAVYRCALRVGATPVSVGRAAGNHLRIDDHSLSRLHCAFTLHSDGRLLVADLHSSNGTAVNGDFLRPDEAVEIHAGDRLQIGDIELTVREIA